MSTESSTRRIAGGGAFVNVAISAAALLSAALLGRAVGPTGRGVVASAVVLGSLAIGLGMGAMPAAVTVTISSRKFSSAVVASSALRIAVAQAAVLMSIGVCGSLLLLEGRAQALTIAYMMVLLPSLAGQYSVARFQGEHRLGYYNGLRLLPAVVVGAVSVISYALGTLTPEVYIGSQVAANVVTWTAASYWGRCLFGTPVGSQSECIAALLKFAVGGYFAQAANSINLRFDQLLLAIFLSTNELGLYVTALAYANLITNVSFAFRIVALPAIAGRRAGRVSERMSKVRVSARTLLVAYCGCGLALGVLQFGLAGWLIPLMFGPSFGGSIGVSKLLTIAMFVYGLKEMFSTLWLGLGRPVRASGGELAGALVSVALGFAIIPSAGVFGAAIVSLMAYALALMVMGNGLRRALVQEEIW